MKFIREYSHTTCKGKYHSTADLLIDWSGLSSFVKFELAIDLRVKPLKEEVSCAMILPLRKYVSILSGTMLACSFIHLYAPYKSAIRKKLSKIFS